MPRRNTSGGFGIATLVILAGCATVPSHDEDSADIEVARDSLTSRIQAETQTWTSTSGDSTSATSSTLRLNANAAGDSFQFATNLANGTYAISLRFSQRNAYGNYTIYVNDTAVGSLAGYSSSTSDTWKTVSLGTKALSGNVVFKFVSTGKNASATDFDAKLDYIELTSTTTGTGGSSSTGGSRATGGSSSTGGSKATGGSSAGGTTSKGGASSTGGSSSGGSTSTGGTSTTGGSVGCTIPPLSNKPIGFGAKVTGGGNVPAIEVNSQNALVAALAAYKGGSSGLVIKYTGTFDFSAIAANPCAQFTKATQIVDFKDMSNVTIIGAPGSAMNFGLHFSRVHNVIIRNLTLGYIPGSGDAIGIEGDSYDFWVDHNELFSSMVECPSAGDLEFDGLLDIKDGSHDMTFSFNYFHDHHKVGLMGSSDSDVNDWRVTLHHNRYENIGSRTPLQRGGTTHIYNNYYNKINVTGLNIRMGGISLIESNYFENSKNPVTSRDSDAIGYWDLRNNFVGGGITWTDGDAPFANANTWTTSKSLSSPLGYAYGVDSASCVKAIALATAGAKL